MKKIDVLSLFGGIECGRVAMQRLGWEVGEYLSSEIDPHAIKTTSKNWPEIKHIGSVTEVKVTTWLDLLIGGSPCQDLSKAKVGGKGLEGEKSRLFFEYVRILKEAKEINPDIEFLLENVASMKKESMDEMTRILREICPETEVHLINSSSVSGQSRPRLYWTNIKGITQPEDKKIHLRDILEDIPEKDHRWKKLDEKYIVDGKVRIPEATKKGYTELESGECVDMAQPNSKSRRGRAMRSKAHTLTTSNFFHQVKEFGGGWYIRALTPTECERLQTLPDGYTEGISDPKRYKAIGNGWTVDVIVHILKNCSFYQVDTF